VTDPNRSHITLIVDRTGSMADIRDDAQGAVRQFIKDQQAVDKPATFLFVQFDSRDRFEVLHDGDLGAYRADSYTLSPRDRTPLLDAIGSGIVLTGERLDALPEDQRPGQVFFAFQTDGQENASKEYTWARIRDMIKHQEDTYNWTFIPLGTGFEAAHQFDTMLVGTRSVHNTVATASTGVAYAAGQGFTSSNIARARVGGQSVTFGARVDDDGHVIPDDPDVKP
jgi:hypothetical protein